MAWFQRLIGTLRPSHVEREIDEEMAFHLEMRSEQYRAEGSSPDEAHQRALRRFGSRLHARERTRDASVLTWLDSVRQDIVVGCRTFRRSPLVAATAILSLGLGIGATASVFSLLDAALLRGLPVNRPGDLFAVDWYAKVWPKVGHWSGHIDPRTGERVGEAVSYAAFRALEQAAAPQATIAGFRRITRTTTIARGEPSTAETTLVSGGHFETVGVRTAAGRLITRADDAPGAAPVAVVSHRFWQRAFGGEASAIGATLSVNGQPFTVVGVAARDYYGVMPGTWVDLYLPFHSAMSVDPDFARRKQPLLVTTKIWWVQMIGRKRPDADAAAVERRLDGVFAQTLEPSALEGLPTRPKLRLRSGWRGYEFARSAVVTTVSILMGLAALVLLVACANVGGLVAAKMCARRQETAMRAALGAGRLRLARQYLTESMLLGTAAGAVGLALANPLTEGLLLLFSAGRSDLRFDVGLNWRILGFVAGVSTTAGLLLGVISSMGLLRSAALSIQRGATHVRTGWARRLGLGRPLVALQIALSLVILAAAGLFVRSVGNLYAVPLGFDATRLVMFEIDPVRSGYTGPRKAELLAGIGRVLDGLPPVRLSTRSSLAPVDDKAAADIIRIPGRPVNTDAVSYFLDVGPRFHETFRIPILLGRGIAESDDASAPRVAVVNESFARTYFPGEPPLGHEILMDFPAPSPPIRIVGVVRDTKHVSVRDSAVEPVIYLPDAQRPRTTNAVFTARTVGDTTTARATIVQAMRKAYPSLPLVRVRTFDEQLGERLATERLLSFLSSAFGVTSLVLAAIGLYGVMAFAVTRRTAELGIRAALGATRAGLVRLVLKDAAFVILPGTGLGMAAAVASAGLIRSRLFGLTPTDPTTLIAAAAVVVCVALVAAYVPARSASRIDPTDALRRE